MPQMIPQLAFPPDLFWRVWFIVCPSRNHRAYTSIERDRKTLENQVDIVLFGAGEAGKSTLFNQMRIVHADGFLPDERNEFRQIIFSNVIAAFKLIAKERRKKSIDYQNECSYGYEKTIICSNGLGLNTSFPPNYLAAIQGLWADEAVQSIVKRGGEFALHDNLP
ncbi:hypothetical protein MMC28_004344 [Mycoblastus sanguinarius]|nr:hypothetical protein [Mycoblastus sanguinarius]